MLSLRGDRQQHPGPLMAILPLFIPLTGAGDLFVTLNKVSYIVHYPH